VDGLTVSAEGNSLTTGEAVAGNYTLWMSGGFDITLNATTESPVRRIMGGFIDDTPDGFRVDFTWRERALVAVTAANGQNVAPDTYNTLRQVVLLTLDKPVRVLVGDGGNLTLKLKKTKIPQSRAMDSRTGGSLWPQVWRSENVKLTVQGEWPKGRPFQVATEMAGSWMALETEVPGEKAGERTGLSVYAALTPTADGFKLSYKVTGEPRGGQRYLIMPSESLNFLFKPDGDHGQVTLKLGEPATVEDATMGKLTFTLAASDGEPKGHPEAP
jgi:hypothetical protein